MLPDFVIHMLFLFSRQKSATDVLLDAKNQANWQKICAQPLEFNSVSRISAGSHISVRTEVTNKTEAKRTCKKNNNNIKERLGGS